MTTHATATPFKKAGYTKDTKFRVLNNGAEEYGIYEGDIVWLHDDGSGYMKYAHVGNGDTSIKAYKKWLWEQKQATPDGWITWHGGECPVPKGTMVHVKFRCGEEAICTAGLSGHDEGFKKAIDSDWVAVDWSVDEVENDIVAYKLFGKPVAEFHKQVEELQEHLRGGIPVDKAFALCTQRTRDELGWSKQPIKTTYTFWLGQDGSVSDEL
jgi:hypothetical protein